MFTILHTGNSLWIRKAIFREFNSSTLAVSKILALEKVKSVLTLFLGPFIEPLMNHDTKITIKIIIL